MIKSILRKIIEWALSKQEFTLKVKYHTDIEPLEQIKKGNWIDLRAAETVVLGRFEHKPISLGVSIELPVGYEAHIRPRSSTFKNFGIIQANSEGVVDDCYCGNDDVWKFSALAMRTTTIHKGDRICQFRIDKIQPKLVFEEVDDLGNENRGGFGSTGVK